MSFCDSTGGEHDSWLETATTLLLRCATSVFLVGGKDNHRRNPPRVEAAIHKRIPASDGKFMGYTPSKKEKKQR